MSRKVRPPKTVSLIQVIQILYFGRNNALSLSDLKQVRSFDPLPFLTIYQVPRLLERIMALVHAYYRYQVFKEFKSPPDPLSLDYCDVQDPSVMGYLLERHVYSEPTSLRDYWTLYPSSLISF